MYIFANVSLILLTPDMFQDKIFIENQNTHFMFNNVLSENRAVYEILWGKKKQCIARQDTDDNTAHALCMLDYEG